MNQAGRPEHLEHFSRTRAENCRKVAKAFMARRVREIDARAGGSILRHYPCGGIHMVYLNGYEDGFAMAVELVLSGALDLKEITPASDPEQASESSGPAESA